MNNNTLEILKLVASFLTPLLVLIFGILLNKKLETSKSTIAKEKGWQEYWSAQFVDVAKEYNDSVTDCVTGLFQIKQISDEKLAGWEDDIKQKEQTIRLSIRKLQYLDWQIQNFIQFSVKKGSDVKNKQKHLFSLISNLIATKQGDLEEIRNAQFEFNETVRLAHAEMLSISPNKKIKPTQKDARLI
jgi:hypothetical protein